MDFDALPRPIFEKVLLMLPPDDLYNAFNVSKRVKDFLSPPNFAQYMSGDQKPDTSTFWNRYFDLWPHELQFNVDEKVVDLDSGSSVYAGGHSNHPLYGQEGVGEAFSLYEDIRQFLKAADKDDMEYVAVAMETPPHYYGKIRGDPIVPGLWSGHSILSVEFFDGSGSGVPGFRFLVHVDQKIILSFFLQLEGGTTDGWQNNLSAFPSFHEIERVTGGKLTKLRGGMMKEQPLLLEAFRYDPKTADQLPKDNLYHQFKKVEIFTPVVERASANPVAADVISLDSDGDDDKRRPDDDSTRPLKQRRLAAQIRRALVLEDNNVEAAAELVSVFNKLRF